MFVPQLVRVLSVTREVDITLGIYILYMGNTVPGSRFP